MTLTSWTHVKSEIARCWPVANFTEVTVLVGVSGGADSVCLLRALHELWPYGAKGRLVVAHLNHRLRADASDGDALFVSSLASSLQLESVIETVDPTVLERSYAPSGTPSEESLRNLRYDFFSTIASRFGARYVALAHTASDNVETVLHNLFRGSGATGLSGIPMFRPLGTDLVVARPLLNVERSEVLNGLAAIHQPYRHDHTNDTDLWNRNWLRNRLLPAIRQRYPNADRAILKAADLIEQQNNDVQFLAHQFIDLFAHTETGRVILRPAGSANLSSRYVVPQSVFIAAAKILFDQQSWPRGAMTKKHWDTLWGVYINPVSVSRGIASVNLPGNLRASRNADESVVVEKLCPD